MSEVKPVVVVPTKSPGVAIILTILFGPLGMFYSTIVGAVVMLIVSLVVGFLTLGIGLLVTWPICIIWGAVAASNYNKKIMQQGTGTPARQSAPAQTPGSPGAPQG